MSIPPSGAQSTDPGTLRTAARVAGVLFLLYIATGIASMILFNQASQGEDTAARIANIAERATTMRLSAALSIATVVYALGLGVTLYVLTRDRGPDLALFAMLSRVVEGVIGAVAVVGTLELVSAATAESAATGEHAASAHALAGLMLRQSGWTETVGAWCFAVGSTVFSVLFLRARSIPVVLAWIGVVASVLLVAALAVEIAGFLRGAMVYAVWIPMAIFEVALALWLIVKGVKPPRLPARATGSS